MSRKIVTFRSQTMGSISDLISDEGLVCQGSQSLLSFLAGELLAYRDEGVELSPTILFCTDTTAVFAGFPGSVSHSIGVVPMQDSSIKQILKDCAPLATRSWCIFIERAAPDAVRYGVFSYIVSPTTIPLRDAISITSEVTCLLLRKVGGHAIEIWGAKGNELVLGFSTRRDGERQQSRPVPPFAADCCADVPPGPYSEDFREYMIRLIEDGLGRSHGTMLACASNPKLAEMGDLKDGIEITPKLDFLRACS